MADATVPVSPDVLTGYQNLEDQVRRIRDEGATAPNVKALLIWYDELQRLHRG